MSCHSSHFPSDKLFKAEPNCKCLSTSDLHCHLFSMKFRRPRILLENQYPDLDETQPVMLKKLVQEVVNPKPDSNMSRYIDATIEFLKNRQRKKVAETKLNNSTLGRKLYFVKVMFPPCKEVFHALIDTGASNSLIHSSVIDRLKIPITPINLKLATATGCKRGVLLCAASTGPAAKLAKPAHEALRKCLRSCAMLRLPTADRCCCRDWVLKCPACRAVSAAH